MKLTNLKLTGLLGVAATVVAFSGTQAFAGVTVGQANEGACYPFACASSGDLTQYQQVYNHAAFSGVTTFNTISFPIYTPAVPTGVMDSGTYDVSFYLSTEPFGSLSDNLASNEGLLLGDFGTFSLSGPIPDLLSLSGSAISYDPTQGDLLMEVTITNIVSLGDDGFFNADGVGTDVMRGWANPGGSTANEVGALQTIFSNGVVPEPATWAMMLAGFGLVGGSVRMARRSQGATV